MKGGHGLTYRSKLNYSSENRNDNPIILFSCSFHLFPMAMKLILNNDIYLRSKCQAGIQKDNNEIPTKLPNYTTLSAALLRSDLSTAHICYITCYCMSQHVIIH